MARSGVTFKLGGSTNKTKAFLKAMQSQNLYSGLEALGARGVEALSAATPVSTGLTASSWSYVVETSGNKTTISWINGNSVGGVNIAVILQYGHGTGTGGWVAGRDYINPAIQPIFDQIANEMWEKVKNS